MATEESSKSGEGELQPNTAGGGDGGRKVTTGEARGRHLLPHAYVARCRRGEPALVAAAANRAADKAHVAPVGRRRPVVVQVLRRVVLRLQQVVALDGANGELLLPPLDESPMYGLP